MRSVSVRGMSGGVFGIVVLAALLAGSALAVARSGQGLSAAVAVCKGSEARLLNPGRCRTGPSVSPGADARLRPSHRSRNRRLTRSPQTSQETTTSAGVVTAGAPNGFPGSTENVGPGRSGEKGNPAKPAVVDPTAPGSPPPTPEEPAVEEPTPEEPTPEEPSTPPPPPEEPTTPPPPPPEEPTSPPPTEPSGCDRTLSSASEAESALASAAAGSVVCLANGSYGSLSLSASKPAPGVTLTAANPGAATIGGVSVSGSGYTISRFVIDGGVSISRNVDRTVVDHNRILGGDHYGVFVCTAEPPDQCNDTVITGNVFAGAMDEDQIRANVFHDGDGDGIGLLVEGNEFRGNQERGGHNDVFQSVWVGDHLVFRKNYLHDFGGQGFFVKDQGRAIDGFVASNNLIVDQDLPCEPASLCSGYQLSPWQVFGPIAGGEMKHNTVGWGSGGGTAVLTGTYTNIDFSDNVFNRLTVTDSGGTEPSMSGSNNTYCDSSGWGVPPGSSVDCSPDFLDPAAGDYRLASGRGVNWVPSAQHYGP
jgi:hypothetical protein